MIYSLLVVKQYLTPRLFLQHMPPVTGRSTADFVGLKNGGATCYMNSVLQQLYMTPGVVESVLAVNDEQIEEDR